MAPRHTAAPAIVGAHRPVAFGDVGGSGLIVVVIVAAWALFLVPQWMHRRASAAQHLADRIPSPEHDDDTSVPARRFGRRELARSSRADSGTGGFFSRWRLPTLPSLTRSTSGSDSGEATPDVAVTAGADESELVVSGDDRADASTVRRHVPAPRSAAARRRRVLIALALATLLTASVVGVAALADLPVPAWLVAIPGGLMVAYLVLLAVVRPGARNAAGAEPVRRRPAVVTPAAAEVADEPSSADTHAPEQIEAKAAAFEAADDSVALPAGGVESTWTPVPLPTPTYVTAARARTVRTIDLSNPGSWTAAPVASPASAGASVTATSDDGGAENSDDYLVEHRRAVGD